MKTLRFCMPAALILSFAAALAFADEPEPDKFFRLQFVVKEVEGSKVLNSRTCTAIVAGSRSGSIRNGTKVQVQNGPNSYQVVNIGIDFDYGQVKESAAGLTMLLNADVSSIPQDQPSNTPPVIRNNQWNSTVTIPVNKPTVVFSSDDLTTKHTMQVELTATPVK